MSESNEAAEPLYFVMREALSVEREDADDDGYIEIEDWEATDGFDDWAVGLPAEEQPKGPVVMNAVPYDGYAGPLDEFKDENVPLMSKRLKETLESAGVDNLRFYPIAVRHKKTKKTHEYFAFNLIGLVDAVDLGKSTMTSVDGDFMGDTVISELSVDEAKPRGLLMFRLKQKFSVILVHRRVKEAVEGAGITSVKFIAPEDFMAL